LAAVAIRGLTVRYGGILALDGLDLDIATGEIFVLLGGSGSGKTTLLRVAGGFLAPDSGTISLDGRDVTALPPHRRPVNTMFQSYALFPHMSVADNVGYGLRRQGMRGAARAARVDELLALVRLERFGGRRIQALSGGQQQRVALARALAPRPQLLLLDEPLSALDRGLREETRADLVSLLRRLGTTAIMVTHDQEEALVTADRIGVLNHGRLEQVGQPAVLYERPATRFVASFLGAANLLDAVVCDGMVREGVVLEGVACEGGVRDGVVRDGGAATVLAVCGTTVTAPASGLVAGTPATLVLRPERLRIGGGGGNVLIGVVEGTAYRGEALDVVVRVADGTRLRLSQPLTAGLGEVPRTGAEVRVCWDPAASILLPIGRTDDAGGHATPPVPRAAQAGGDCRETVSR
jgi:ABC-type Fe3+/spermidine/putrescine transport system ATPase subunit